MAGSVFLWEGLIKFYFRKPGTGRFAKLGFPAPNLIATSTAWLEIIGGIFLIVGLLSRPVALLFVIEMLVAMLSTKIPLLREPIRWPFLLHPHRSAFGLCFMKYDQNTHSLSVLFLSFLVVQEDGQ
jgi:hypothetical protein